MSTETLEIDAQGREALVLDLALPILAAWSKSVHVFGFRPSMGVSGLSPREVARLRTLGLATASRGTGVFEGANDFRMAFHAPLGGAERPPATGPLGVEADLAGHPLAPVVSDLMIASFGLPKGTSLTHRLRGFTHPRSANAQGFATRTLTALGREFDLDLKVRVEDLGFEPQGQGGISIAATRGSSDDRRATDWKNPGETRAVHALIGGVRPKLEQMDRLEACLRETLWETRRIEPVVERLITPGVDLGAFLQMDVECAKGGATFMDVAGRSAAPLHLARRMVKKALGFVDSSATFDEITGPLALGAALAARSDFELALVPSERLSAACSLLRDIGAYIEEEEALGLVVLKTREHHGSNI